MKKGFIAVGVALLALLAIVIVSGEISNHVFNSHLASRRAHWTEVIETEVPLGATREDVARWAKRTFPSRGDHTSANVDPALQIVNFPVETFPAPGLRFPCAAWSIIIEIAFDASGHVTERKASEVGACL